MTKETEGPVWGYKLVDGEVEAKLFADGLPKGWADSHAKLKDK